MLLLFRKSWYQTKIEDIEVDIDTKNFSRPVPYQRNHCKNSKIYNSLLYINDKCALIL